MWLALDNSTYALWREGIFCGNEVVALSVIKLFISYKLLSVLLVSMYIFSIVPHWCIVYGCTNVWIWHHQHCFNYGGGSVSDCDLTVCCGIPGKDWEEEEIQGDLAPFGVKFNIPPFCRGLGANLKKVSLSKRAPKCTTKKSATNNKDKVNGIVWRKLSFRYRFFIKFPFKCVH